MTEADGAHAHARDEPEEVNDLEYELTQLQAEVEAPGWVEARKALDTQAQWLFGVSAGLAAVATVAEATGVEAFSGWGRLLFLAAILLWVLALAVAMFALRPTLATYNPHSPDSLRAAIEDNQSAIQSKRRRLSVAYTAFALALVAAAVGVATSGTPVPAWSERADVAVAAKQTSADATSIEVEVASAAGSVPVEVLVGTEVPDADECLDNRVLARADGRTNPDGEFSTSLEISEPATPMCLAVKVEDAVVHESTIELVAVEPERDQREELSYQRTGDTYHVSYAVTGLDAGDALHARAIASSDDACTEEDTVVVDSGRSVADDQGRAEVILRFTLDDAQGCIDARWTHDGAAIDSLIPLGP